MHSEMDDGRSVGELVQLVQRSTYAGPPAAERVQHLRDLALPLSEIGRGGEEFVNLTLGQRAHGVGAPETFDLLDG